MEHLFHLLVGGTRAHPQLALAIVGLVAMAESLAVIGTVVPAAVVMFAAGALVGQGALALEPLLAVAVLGAVTGDALSFELGHRYEERVRDWSVFRRHLRAVRRAEGFVQKHGALAIVLARFMGAVRAFVPLLAGFASISRPRFYLTNIGSALLWAPVHILPGVLFGGSLELAEAVSGRLVVMILLVVGLVALAVWVVTKGLRRLLPLAQRARREVVDWAGRRSGRIASLALDLLDPGRPGSHALLLGGIVLLGAGWMFLGVLQDVVAGDPLVHADQAVYGFFQSLRNEVTDRVMILITELGGAAVLLPVIGITALWLALHGGRRTLVYWVGSVAVAELLVKVLKLSLGRQRPSALYAGIERLSFPSGHATMSTVVLGFLAFLVTRGGSSGWRSLVLGLTASYVMLVALSRLYLGAHWLSDVLAGMSLGLVWVAFCAMVYARRNVDEPLHSRRLAGLVAVTIIGATAVWHRYRGSTDAAFYAVRPVAPRVVAGASGASGWPGVPRRRRDLGGDFEEAFGLRWACASPIVEQGLRAGGWEPAPAWNLKAALAALTGQQSLVETPVLPRLDRGQPNAASWVRPQGAGQRRVLRLWRSATALSSGASVQPVWYGAVYDEVREPNALLKGWIRVSAIETDPTNLEQSLGVPTDIVWAEARGSVLMLRCR